MKVLIIGASGLQGAILTNLLAKEPQISHLTLADVNLDRAQELAKNIGNKASAVKLDINDHPTLVSRIKEADLVCNMAGPYWDVEPKVVKAAIEAKRNYVDINDDYIVMDVLKTYGEQAQEAGITILCGIGAAPGLTNVWARDGASKLDNVERVKIYLLAGLSLLGAAAWAHVFEYYDAFKGKVPVFRNGAVQYITPGTEPETVDLPPPVGRQETYILPHAEPLMLSHNRPLMKGVEEIVVKGGFGKAGKEFTDFCLFLREIGLVSKEPMELMGQKASPREFLVQFLVSDRFKESDFFKALEVSARESALELELMVDVAGRKGVEKVGYNYRLTGNKDISIVAPTAVAVKFIAEGKIIEKGIIFPETIEPGPFLAELRKSLTWAETQRKEE